MPLRVLYLWQGGEHDAFRGFVFVVSNLPLPLRVLFIISLLFLLDLICNIF
jgi:hypothetical protein